MDANYNLSGLIDRLKIRLDDQEYDETAITQFINDAYFDVLGEEHYQFLEKIYTATTQTPSILPLPRDYQSLITMTATIDNNTFPFKYMDYKDFLNMAPEDGRKNYCFTVFGSKLFYNVPDVSDEEDEDGEEKFYTLNLFYLAKPLPLVEETDVPVIPYEFGEVLVMGALARAERLRDNFDYAAIYENKYDELVTNMKLRYCPRQARNANRAHLPVNATLRH